MIDNEKDVCEYLNIPSIPQKEFNGKESFKDGVAIVNLLGGGKAYAVATFNNETDSEPRIKKVFGVIPYIGVEKIFVVPQYMNEDVSGFDMDEKSKKAAQAIIDEAHELEGLKKEDKEKGEEKEWVFDEINNKEEAVAFIRKYRSMNKIKGKVPENEDAIKAYLLVIKDKMEEKLK